MYLLASDFDNTLLFYEGMKENDLKAIKRFQKKGHLFGLCTGRTLEGVLRPSKDYDIQYDFYILNTGSYILDKDLNVIFQKKIPMEIVKELQSLVGNDIHMSIVFNNQMMHIDKQNTANYPGIKINSLEELDAVEVEACSFHYPKGQIREAKEMIDIILERLGDKVSAYQNNEHIDCTALGCSKGNGIDIIKDYFHLDDCCIFGIGDSFNDLPMFSHVGTSYTFNYSDRYVQEQATCIVSTLEECIYSILD